MLQSTPKNIYKCQSFQTHNLMFEIFETSTSKHKKLWYDNDYNTIGFGTSYTSSFVESFNSRIIGSTLTLPNIDASN